MIVLALLISSLLLGGLFLLSLLPSELDFDPVHAPHECNLALCGHHQFVPYRIEVVIVPFESLLSEYLAILLPHPTRTIISLIKLTRILSTLAISSGQTD